MGLFGSKKKLDDGLKKTRNGFFGNILNMMGASEIDDDLYEELEEQLILADTGADMASKLVDELSSEVKHKHLKTGPQALEALEGLIEKELTPDSEFDLSGKPAVILVIGVNGVGKTTSIAKLANLYKSQGKRVMLAAGDTFRAAAAEQLSVWADRAGVPLVKAGEGADPAAVIFDAVQSAAARGYDLVICDTAGRLHNKKNLMDELTKIRRAVPKACAEASVETLLVLDAITGQNAISQAREFVAAAEATGVILTKLDGDTRGGAALSVRAVTGKPIMFTGVGEKLDELDEFHPDRMASRILGMGDVLSLIERVESEMDQKKAEEAARKLEENRFDMNDLLEQFRQIKKMGSLKSILSMLPGMDKQLRDVDIDDRQLLRIEAIIKSMTKKEREKPDIINASRRRRIAAGSGMRVEDVNKLLRQYEQMKKMFKQMNTKGGKRRMMHNLRTSGKNGMGL